ncbi:MAG: transcription termination/antitermination protein NusA, partial [Paludibacteraceae bacterium]|nr:transcription termination/antitermination protein NusA [Paludibacteraceae bacterium]
MAKSEETLNLMDSFAEFKEQKNIDRSTLVSVLEESIRNVIIKMFGSDENYNVIINPDKGNFEIWRTRTVVKDEDLQDKDKEISLSEVKALGEDFELGEEYSDKVDFLKFGRRAILNLRQILASKILELQKDALYAKYSEKVGQIITGEVYQTWKKEVLLLDD